MSPRSASLSCPNDGALRGASSVFRWTAVFRISALTTSSVTLALCAIRSANWSRAAASGMPAATVSGYLGVEVTADQVKSSLTKLGYACSDDLTHIAAPTRRVDVNDAVVLIEDVARVIGYEAIKPAPSAETPSAGCTTALDFARQSARGLLAGDGFLEVRGVPLEPLEGEARFSQLEGT